MFTAALHLDSTEDWFLSVEAVAEQEIGLQKNELREFAERRGWQYQIFTDRG